MVYLCNLEHGVWYMDCTINTELLPDIAGIISIADGACPVAWARDAADIARMGCCGKSVMCRDGMQQLYTIIRDITTGKGQADDILLLSDVCGVISASQGCELAMRSSELISASLERYPDEWAGHIRRKRCTAGICYDSPVPVRSVGQSEDGEGMRRRRRKASDAE